MSSVPTQNGSGEPSPGAKKGSIEKIYQKKSQLEHILLRPDTYIGSVERATENMWVFDKTKECMVQRELTFVPGLYKIYDEILVNAADNKQRDKKMDVIKIDINQDTNTISVYNNGCGIPVVMHKDEKMYVPTMIFGHLLTSSNYNDEEEKVTGGRNGYGAKLCNIFSTKFTVETASKKYKKHFKQTWGSNMTKASEPKVKESGKDDDYTKVTFSPDLSKFKMDKLEDDIVAIMSRRAYDVAAASVGVKVYLNGERLKISKFKDYVDLYIKGKEDENGQPLKVVYEKVNDRWEVALTLSDRGFQQVSFVNSIATTKGGKHVDSVSDSVVKSIIEVLKKKNKGGVNIKPFQVKNHMWVFINCLIVNPTFDSQTKENMTLQAKSFGSKCTLSEKFITAVSKSGIVESVLTWAKFKAQTELVKASGKKQSKLKGIPKLEDANDAGTKNSHLCTLILTEGDSAKTLAVSGLSVVGRDHYGVFPLKGKPLNVRDASHKQVLENVEINNLIKILGLQYKKKYLCVDDLKSLRYGKVMIMADQDQDGSHIKGLIINFVHHNWPDLLKLPFLEEFITPIVKATKKDKEISFYSLPEFEEWKNDTDNHHTYNIKYYKGLGTSTSKEAKEYFQNMERHRIKFKYGGTTDDHHIELAFSKKGADQRKEWLTSHMDEVKRRKEIGLPERYLYTKDTKTHEFEDNQKIEPVYYLPIIPMMLVNGAEGIGTGWSTKIPQYNPRDIIQNLRRLLDGEEPKPMHPWYKNFRGTVEGFGDKYVISGEAAILPGDKIEISELPVGSWTQNYKENLAEVEAESIHKVFKLQTTISLTCMNAFDHNCCLHKLRRISSQIKPGSYWRSYAPDPISEWKKKASKIQGLTAVEEEDVESEDEPDTAETDKGKPADPEVKKFNYLLGMSMWMLTKEKKDELLKQRDQKLSELSTLKAKTPSMLWREDLDALLIKLDEVEKKERDEESANANKNKNRKSMFEIIPSSNGRRVEPKISEDLIKRIQAAEKVKSRKDLKKEYDPKEKAEKPEKEKDGLKQTKLAFKKEPKKKKMVFSGSESGGEKSDSDVELADAPAPRERSGSRRAATKVHCLFDSLIEDSKKVEKPQNNHNESVVLSSDDEPVRAPSPVKTPPKKKAAPKRKLMNVDKEESKPKKRPLKATKSNPKKKAKKKGSSDSDSDCKIADSPPAAARGQARARPAKKYNYTYKCPSTLKMFKIVFDERAVLIKFVNN
ncbi:DNA topoisomerase 2 [Operophtera brumata]|uniref:DNA topoisomerase 2 n=1 Tax=Operophtera brumata TaxID=104452 RepID=A0A0L7LQL5_OPEBR|nr:DNA topoisomerase 2 [Operophtera brumata]